MSKFKVGDRVVIIPDNDVDRYFKDRAFYLITGVNEEDGLVTLVDDEGDAAEWYDWRFEFYEGESPKETANDIAPLSLIQYHVPLILQWGRDRGILDNSTPLGQSRKTVEETFELVEAAAQLVIADARCDEEGSLYASDLRREVVDRLADAIGDIFVTLVMVAGCAKLDINACVAQAYEEIKNRKGKMNDKGVWVKEEEQV